MPGRVQSSGSVTFGFGSINTMSRYDVEAIKKECPSIQSVSGQLKRAMKVQYGRVAFHTMVSGTDEDDPVIFQHAVAEGRYFTRDEIATRQRICVLGQTTSRDLFGAVRPIDKSIVIEGISFRVVGLFKDLSGRSSFSLDDDTVYIPITTMSDLAHRTQLSSIACKVKSAEVMDQAQRELDAVLIKRHNIKPGAAKDYITFKLDDVQTAR